MLGSPDPQMRDGLAYPTLATWVDRGVYDDLIMGLLLRHEPASTSAARGPLT